MSDKDANEDVSQKGSDQQEIEEEEQAPAYVPKNPMIRPEDVKISKIMADLMAGDLQ